VRVSLGVRVKIRGILGVSVEEGHFLVFDEDLLVTRHFCARHFRTRHFRAAVTVRAKVRMRLKMRVRRRVRVRVRVRVMPL
jgi:hypothetical protein